MYIIKKKAIPFRYSFSFYPNLSLPMPSIGRQFIIQSEEMINSEKEKVPSGVFYFNPSRIITPGIRPGEPKRLKFLQEFILRCFFDAPAYHIFAIPCQGSLRKNFIGKLAAAVRPINFLLRSAYGCFDKSLQYVVLGSTKKHQHRGAIRECTN